MDVEPDRAAGTESDPLYVRRNDAEVPLPLLIRLVGLSFLGYVVLTLIIAWFLWNNSNDHRFADQRAFAAQLASQNEGLTRRLNQARLEQGRRIQTVVAALCADAELRDTVITKQNLAIISLLESVPEPVPPKVQALIDASRDGIRTLEPKGEKDCPLPPGEP